MNPADFPNLITNNYSFFGYFFCRPMDEQPSQLRGPAWIRVSREFSGSRAYLRRKPRTGLKNFRDHPQNFSFRSRGGLGLALEPELQIGNIIPARVGGIKMFLAPLAKETRGFQKNIRLEKALRTSGTRTATVSTLLKVFATLQI